MSKYARLLSLVSLASFGGASYSVEPPFSVGYDSGTWVALRLISDETRMGREPEPGDDPGKESSPEQDPEVADPPAETPSARASDTAPSQEDLPDDPGLRDGREEDGEAGGFGLEDAPERDPEPARSPEEESETSPAHARGLLDRVDQILLDARDQAREERNEQAEEGGVTESAGEGEDATAREGRESESESESDEVAAGQIPGVAPTGKTRPPRGHGEDDDTGTRSSGAARSQEDIPGDPGLRDGREEDGETAEREATGEAGGFGLEDAPERDPEPARSPEEESETSPAHARGLLDRVDQILLDARDQAREERNERAEEGGAAESAGEGEDATAREGRESESESESDEVAAGQIPGVAPTGKTRPPRGYGEGGNTGTRASGAARSQEDILGDPGLPDGREEDSGTAGREATRETGGFGLEDDIERDPELAGRRSLEEGRETSLARARGLLDRVDQILLDARGQAREERNERAGRGGADESAGGSEEATARGGRESESESESDEVAEGQIPGDTPTGKTRPPRGYGEDDDIVARQVCELAEQEEDPEIKKSLKEKCETLKKG